MKDAAALLLSEDSSLQHLVPLLALPDEQVPPLAKAGLIYGSALSLARQTIVPAPAPAVLDDVQDLIAITVAYLDHHRTAFSALLAVMCHDFSEYTHSVNVAVYTLGLAYFSGIKDHDDLRNLGFGALVHDLGKAELPKDLLTKQGPLTDSEWANIRQHPTLGREMLYSVGDFPDVVLSIVEQHHERLDGSGYPNGIAGGELHSFSMIVGLVDAYEAMTAHRPYRMARTPFNALMALKRDIEGKLDNELFLQMIRLLAAASKSDTDSG